MIEDVAVLLSDSYHHSMIEGNIGKFQAKFTYLIKDDITQVIITYYC